MNSFGEYIEAYQKIEKELVDIFKRENSSLVSITEQLGGGLNKNKGYFECRYPSVRGKRMDFIEISNLIDKIKNKRINGIYILIIRKKKSKEKITKDELANLWNKYKAECFKENKNLPTFYENNFSSARLNYSTNGSDDNYILYIGKSEDLTDRLKKHYEYNTSGKTYTLRLNKFLNNNLDYEVLARIIYSVSDKNKINTSTILSLVEKKFHEKYHPLVGTKR